MRCVDYYTGKLKHRFLHIAKKKERGVKGQYGCFAEALASVYPDQKEITPENVIELLKKFYVQEPDNGDIEEDDLQGFSFCATNPTMVSVEMSTVSTSTGILSKFCRRRQVTVEALSTSTSNC